MRGVAPRYPRRSVVGRTMAGTPMGVRPGARRAWAGLVALCLCFCLCPRGVVAQYFGRNRPTYDQFPFEVRETSHLALYHYFDDENTVRDVAWAGEVWYRHHARLFADSLPGHNPIILYQNSGDFQQTTAIEAQIGVGVGGVTEGLKNRVVLPLADSWQQSVRVLGHELVHAFQYNLILNGDSTNMQHLQQIPLWMIEGMAEYFTLGANDAHTAMWMRDAVLGGFFPSIEALQRDAQRYFPYRYGQAFWAWFAQRYGDDRVVPFLRKTAIYGLPEACVRYLDMDQDSLSGLWQEDSKRYYGQQIAATTDREAPGELLVFEKNAGEANISPSISPDGRWVAFFSEKNLFSIDLFLADAKSGKIVRTLSSVAHGSEVDALNFIESAGGWSADSRYFAFVGYRQGRNVLLIVDAAKGRLVRALTPEGLRSFSHPTWRPDGQAVVVSGLAEGRSHLYELGLEDEQPRQLTRGHCSFLQPCYSPDGQRVLFTTDSLADASRGGVGYSIGELELADGTLHLWDVFPGARNVNPVYAPVDGRVYFLSDCDGYRNLYSLQRPGGMVYRLTSLPTGISGMTPLSPAISVARDEATMVYSLFRDGKFRIYRARPQDFKAQVVSSQRHEPLGARLAPGRYDSLRLVADTAGVYVRAADRQGDSLRAVPYRDKFRLDFISNAGVGVSTSMFGTGMAGGVEMLFSDIMGRHLLVGGISLNGEIWDFGGQLTYINRCRPLHWAVGLSHIPYSTGYYSHTETLVPDADGEQHKYDTVRMYHLRKFESQVAFMVQYPVSQAVRVESGGALGWYSHRLEEHVHAYVDDKYVSYDRHRMPTPPGFWLWRAYMASVLDNSYFGLASPMRGARYRWQVERVGGGVRYWGTLVDMRKYWFVEPVSLALRGYFNARWGIPEETRYVYPLYVGYPWIIRGYELGVFLKCYSSQAQSFTINQLMGSRMVVANAEVRIPMTGPKRLALVGSRYFFTELILFADAGLVWYNWQDVRFHWRPSDQQERTPLLSVGASIRLNLFGMLVVEPYYAVPFQLGGVRAGNFGLNFTPGW